MSEKYILALDQGTTSSRSILFKKSGEIVAMSQKDFEQLFPQQAWVEHCPQEIWSSQLHTIREVMKKANIHPAQIAGIGITNQRETTIVWDRLTGKPIYNAIVWQDRRTAAHCDEFTKAGHHRFIQEKTGLVLDAYFSATKVAWILDHVAGAREKAVNGTLCFGTVDSWLVWQLTQGATFITDVTNASRTLLFNIHTLSWDDELLNLFTIPRSMLPEVRESSEIYAYTHHSVIEGHIPIAGIAGDQQAALFGQLCTDKGMLKNTYGTGCFLLMNTGEEPVMSKNNLLTTVAWKINGKVSYALEGSVFVGGASVQWLRDGIEMITDAQEIEELAMTVEDNGGVYFVPALTGLGAPYWDPYARGGILGITRGTKKGHIARATLEGIAYQVYDIVKAMEEDAEFKSKELRVDGGASANNLLMQFQADVCDVDVLRPQVQETTALGAAYLAGLAVGYWHSIDALQTQWCVDQRFVPSTAKNQIRDFIRTWHKAVSRVRGWVVD